MFERWKRRDFLAQLVVTTSATAILPATALGLAARPSTFRFISTWKATLPAVRKSREVMLEQGKLLDAVEQGIRLEEENADNSSVGLGGTPNADGVVQLDACIMHGPGHQAGAVAAIEDIPHPISVARRVMETTPHVMLVGAGARKFAIESGFPTMELLTASQRKRWEQRQDAQRAKATSGATPSHPQHDTIALIGIDRDRNLAGGCSTSGWGYKIAGRVGDSPIIGSGLYVDNEFGAAGATGTGENVMRYCGSFMVVEAIRSGKSPQAACEEVVRRISRKDPQEMDELHINFIAIDRQGRVGAAGTDQGFGFAVTDAEASEARDAVWIHE